MTVRTYPIRRTITTLREHADAPHMVYSSRIPGTVYTEFNEEWDDYAEMPDESQRKRIAYTPTGKQYKLIKNLTYKAVDNDPQLKLEVSKAGRVELSPTDFTHSLLEEIRG